MDGLVSTHITKLWSTTEDINIAVNDGSTKITSHRFCCIETTCIELVDVSILYLPGYITGIVVTICTSNALHSSATDGAKATTVDIALGIVALTGDVGLIEAGEVKLIIIATRHRNW